jgi:hypothetical protein
MDGTLSRDGKLQASMVHTAGVPSSAVGYAQQRSMTLGADGRTLRGNATFTGGGHSLEWRRTAAPSTSQPPQTPPPASGGGAWTMNAEGYPSIEGDWTELPGHPVRVTQRGGGFTATCTYRNPQGGTASWRMDGTLSRDGKLQASMVHTAGVPSSAVGYAQQRSMTLGADGGTLRGNATFTGGGHSLEWRRTAAPLAR